MKHPSVNQLNMYIIYKMYKLLIQYLKSMAIVSLDLFVNGRVAAGRDGFKIFIKFIGL